MKKMRFQIAVTIAFVTLISLATTEDRNDRAPFKDELRKPSEKQFLKKVQPYPEKKPQEEKSFMSTLTSWIFPFGSSDEPADLLPSEGRHSPTQYLPPTHHHKPFRQNCNPCNDEPWVPIAGTHGHNTVIGFVPPSHVSSQKHNFPPQTQYGPPAEQHLPPSNQYGPPQIHNGPPVNQYGPPPSQYGPPESHHAPPSNQYGPPTNQYGPPPPANQYGPPSGGFGGHDHQIIGAHSELQLSTFPPKRPSREPPIRIGTPKQYMSPPPLPTGNKFQTSFTKIPHTTTKLFKTPKFSMFPPLELEPKPPRQHSTPVYFNTFFPPHNGPSLQPNLIYDSLPNPIPLHVQEFKYAPPINKPIPLPNLSYKPVLPVRNPSNFHSDFHAPLQDNVLQGSHVRQQQPQQHAADIQIIPSIPVADYLASIEHPINVVQSPLVEVSVKEEGTADEVEIPNKLVQSALSNLKENPIVVPDEDVSAAESNHNDTYDGENHNKRGNDQELGITTLDSNPPSESASVEFIDNFFTQNPSTKAPVKELPSPPTDFSNWKPTYASGIVTSMVPPPMTGPGWHQQPTSKPRPVQVIVPYITNNPPEPFKQNQGRKVPPNSTKLYKVLSPPQFMQLPSQEESVWTKYGGNDHDVAPKQVSTQRPVSNIRDLLKGEMDLGKVNETNLPFDILTLQKYIDDWTQQEFSNQLTLDDNNKSSTSGRLVPSKNIPSGYLTTLPYDTVRESTTPKMATSLFDHFAASSNNREAQVQTDLTAGDVENSIFTDVTENIKTSTSILEQERTESWEHTKVSILPVTKERVYIVTPSPLKNQGATDEETKKTMRTPSFAIRIESGNDTIKGPKNSSNVIYSEWPHLINGLETTSTTRHPLFGLMDIAAYTPPPNSTVQTYAGHSKVVTVVTPSSVQSKQNNPSERTT